MSDLSRSLTVYLLLRANRSQSLNIWAILSNRAKSERANSQPWFWCGDVLKDPVGACNASLMVCFSTCRVINWSGAAPAMSPIKGCCTSRAEINEGASLAMSQSKGAASAESQSMRVLLQQCHQGAAPAMSLTTQMRNQKIHNRCECCTNCVAIFLDNVPAEYPFTWVLRMVLNQQRHLLYMYCSSGKLWKLKTAEVGPAVSLKSGEVMTTAGAGAGPPTSGACCTSSLDYSK